MRLLQKKNVFLQSANAGSGTSGNFTIDLPSSNTFQEDHLFKVYISRIHLRNSFLYVTNANSQFFWCVLPQENAKPNPPTSVAVPGVWTPGNLPQGCPVDIDICNYMNSLLVNGATYMNLRCVLRNGRMYFNFLAASGTASAQFYLYLYFAQDGSTGPAHQCFGFPSANQIYTIYPDHGGVQNAGTDASARLSAYDSCPYNPAEAAMSPQLIDCNPLTDILVITNLPSDNYCYSKGSLTNNGVAVLLPVDQPPLAMLDYKDNIGGNAIYQRGRSVASSLSLQLVTRDFVQLDPITDWSFVITMEEYEDTDKLLLDNAKKLVSDDEEMIQIMKMTLLQKELKKRK